MRIYDTKISDVKIFEYDCYRDYRGYLSVPISISELKKLDIQFNIVQVNQGFSYKKNTIRGMHYQEEPYSQAKLVSSNYGSFYSVAVDIRVNSDTFGQWVGEIISLENKKVMYIPKGFAHGYVTLEDKVILQYCVDNEYSFKSAKALRFDDKDVNVQWPVDIDYDTLTEKDINALSLREIQEHYK